MTITTPLSSFSNWTSATAAEVVGLQWQWTYSGANIPADGGVDASAALPDQRIDHQHQVPAVARRRSTLATLNRVLARSAQLFGGGEGDGYSVGLRT